MQDLDSRRSFTVRGEIINCNEIKLSVPYPERKREKKKGIR